MRVEKTRQEVILEKIASIIKYWEEGIFSNDEAANRIMYYTNVLELGE